MRSSRLWWTVFTAGAIALVGGLLWLSAAVLTAERADLAARAEAERVAATRLSLWRLDAWVGGFLAREATRSHFDYQPVQTAQAVQAVQAVSSPLVDFESDYIRFHFQVDASGRWSSPQALTPARSSDLEALAGTFKIDTFEIDTPEKGTSETAAIETTAIERRLTEVESLLDRRLDTAGWPGFAPELSRRAAAGAQCELPSEAPFLRDLGMPRIGPFIPLWLDQTPISDEQGPEFLFIRRVEWSGDIFFQGFLGRWQSLRRALLVEISDLLPEADLRPLTADASGSAVLATLPAALYLDAPAPEPAVWTASKSKLAAIWLAAGVAIAAVGLTLRASIGFGRRRQRFAAAMAHELRTPLTTFQMYTEMLADGTIKDPQQRREYLDILQEESRRLSGLVENVLLHAGLEERPASSRREELCVADLLAKITPPLHRHARDAGFRLEVEGRDVADVMLAVEVDSIERMLFNLVDNACKYATQARAATIHLTARITKRDLILRVRDHGPGVPIAHRREIFRPFSRGDQAGSDQASNPRTGAGLGLALVRDLARSSGGDLVLDPSPGDGACFELRLPVLA